MNEEIRHLRESLDYYKTKAKQFEELFEKQRETIDKYHQIFMMQEAELQLLRGEKQ